MKSFRTFVPSLTLIFAAIVASNCGAEKASRTDDASTLAMNAANDDAKAANDKMAEINTKNFPADRAAIKTMATAGMASMVKSAAGFRDTAAKLQKVADAAKDSVVKEYYSLRAQAMNKMADSKDIAKETFATFLDDTIADAAALDAKQTPIAARELSVYKEFEALDAKAKKLADDNKDKFKD